jgi:hypothetical protein
MIKVVTPTEQALAPTITEVSTTDSEIVFTITNNDASTAVILYEVGDSTPDENSIELAASTTSSNLTISGLTPGTTYTIYAWATVTGKVQSALASEAIETDISYTAATGGTTEEYDDGGKRYRSHTFTSDDDFEVTTVGDADGDRNKVDYLIIAGGGSGSSAQSGGGGAGGYRTTFGTQGGLGTLDSKITVTAQTYGVIVGAGGTNPTDNGNDSSVFSRISLGGGFGGGGQSAGSSTTTSGTGGSGGGGAGSNNSPAIPGADGTTNQGFAGGSGRNESANGSGGGGGGAGELGFDSTATRVGGNGGDGLSSIIRTGSAETRAGGGGGGIDARNANGTGGLGGSGGGGDAKNDGSSGDNGTVNTGGGGAGGGRIVGSTPTSGGNGGSGIVIIRYEIAPSV